MINNLIITTLSPLGVPVTWQKYSGTQTTYITFFNYIEQGELYADDLESVTGYYVQVDIWSKEDYATLADQVRTAMEGAGFRRTSAIDLYESDTYVYHKAMRFYIETEV